MLAGLAAASIQGRVALGPGAGGEVRRCGSVLDEAPLAIVGGPCHAALAGFDLDAGVVVPAGGPGSAGAGLSLCAPPADCAGPGAVDR